MENQETETVAKVNNLNLKKEIIVKSNAQRQKEFRERKKNQKQLQSPKKIPKTNAQRQQQFWRNQKEKLQQNETLNLARKKKNAECAKRYRDKLKLKKQCVELDSVLSSKGDSIMTILMENNKEIHHCHDTEELIYSQFQIQQPINIEAQQVISPSFPSFVAPSEEHVECSTPNILLHHRIKDMQTSQLADSDYCNGCSNIITGFRYICVQCTDVQLCAACEVEGLHPLHYMLRAPRWRPSEEIARIVEKIREELFKLEDSVKSINTKIKEEPNELEVAQRIHIDTSKSKDNLPMYAESQVTEDTNTQTAADIPNKRSRMKMEQFSNFIDQNAPSHSTARSAVPDTKNIFVNLSDIKIEVEISEDTKCEVLMYKGTDSRSSDFMTMASNLSDPGTDQRGIAFAKLGLGESNCTAGPVASYVMVAGARPVESIGPLEPVIMAPPTPQRGTAPKAPLSRPASTPSRPVLQLEITDTDTVRKGTKRKDP